ncbi:BAR-domain-containing protein [Metschnikowia bicuspidata var. bicuspidata NRRL YB-4993]|uniref:BAR-domain-containing protein n=1 Tax=Metschnikowia bicuspidata var. bicuspidata NRRL YB-4993 TaxID=869754 RepID=A0A1A0H4T0_9ASCO|nr:BAR-domain-containing protein [Metschnikowia bicuspidata var. bicuspidata NRRL YB-4993]OBA19084.1 BAR-domain-containing protein [Metschnikowia bicuspidata var. bicuspidata NRRL YB-4993]
MSWQVLKNAISRAGALVLKPGPAEDTTDLEFEYEEKRYRAMETVTTRLEKELRHYIDSLRTLTNAQESMTLVLSGFYGEDENTIAHMYYTAMKELSQTCLEELEEPFLKTVLNPVERFNSYYINVNEAIKKRAKKKNAYDSLRTKLKKLDASPSDDPSYELKLSDLSKELEQAHSKYAYFNDQLKAELPTLVDMRIPYLNPLFESFVKIQLRFFNENFERINEVELVMDAQTRLDYVNGALEAKMDNILDKIKELNIAI